MPGAIEIFEAEAARCPSCNTLYPMYNGNLPDTCCGSHDLIPTGVLYIWYWYCLPGCLPDSDPFGPFNNLAEAEADIDQCAEE